MISVSIAKFNYLPNLPLIGYSYMTCLCANTASIEPNIKHENTQTVELCCNYYIYTCTCMQCVKLAVAYSPRQLKYHISSRFLFPSTAFLPRLLNEAGLKSGTAFINSCLWASFEALESLCNWPFILPSRHLTNE